MFAAAARIRRIPPAAALIHLEQLLAADPREALLSAQALLARIAAEQAEVWQPYAPYLASLGSALARDGTYLAAGDVLLEMAQRCEGRLHRRLVLQFLGLDRGSPVDWNLRVAERVLRPWLTRAFECGKHDEALELEQDIYSKVTLMRETEAHFRHCVSLSLEPARAAGRRLALPRPKSAPAAVPRIAFFVHGASMLAHVRMMLGVLQGLAAIRPPPIEPMVYVFYGFSAELDAALSALQVPTVYMRREGTSGLRGGYDELLELRKRIEGDRVDALVWVSVVTMMPFAFAMRIAPVQIWWAMKYHGVDLPEIDGYLTGAGVSGGFKTIAERRWRVAPVGAADWFAPELAAKARQTRSAFARFRILFASLAREEKLRDPVFLETVACILRQVEDCAFLWTGREPLTDVQRAFETLGVAERCFFIGWVDSRLYAQVIDVFLDSFPAPCGYTLYESMAAGRPVVLFASNESEHTGVHALVGPLLARSDGTPRDWERAQAILRPSPGLDLYLRATNVEQYAAHAVRLARDDAFRKRAGAACEQFVAEFMSDRERMARIYADHLLAVVAETAARASVAH